MTSSEWDWTSGATDSQTLFLLTIPNQYPYIQLQQPTFQQVPPEQVNEDIKNFKAEGVGDLLCLNQPLLMNDSLEVTELKKDKEQEETNWIELDIKQEPDLIEVKSPLNEDWFEFKIKKEVDENYETLAKETESEKQETEYETEKAHPTPKKTKFFECEHCSYKTNWKGNLTKHVVSRHTALEEIKWFDCEHCPYKGKTRDYLKWHMLHVHNKSVKWYGCSQCPFKAKLKSLLDRHVIINHTESEKIKWLACDRCPYKAKFKINLKQHVLSKHTKSEDIKWIQCEYCPFKAKRRRNLKFHQINKHTDHDKIQWFQCELCPYKVKIKSVLKSHVAAAHTEKGKRNKKNKLKTREIPVFIGNKLCWKRVVDDGGSSEECKFKCAQCPFETAEKEHFKKHVLKVHTVTEIETNDDGFVKTIRRTKDVVVMVDNTPYVRKVIDS
ncbi:hypothetical protein BDFB_009331 [Asbolus verrucosus]|uniref:C2H2-type domain-containing protein n=1 Tax=Asbolus verrucosus TaxID=1661398 RepID=A0A482V1C0_ASBVE|nr:hypothetical protein BDFB_009331 [Asbolus verrucosus]